MNDKRRSDKGFESELESLYKNIAREEDPSGASSKVSDLGRCYALLQVHPDASLAEIAAAYEAMKDTWREDRFAHVEAWQGKAREKLAAIKEAYETILANRPFDSPDDSDEKARHERVFSPNLYEEETLEDAEPDHETVPDRRSGLSVGTLQLAVAAVLATAMVFIALFIWPTPYRYDVFRSSDRTYPLKINRLTGTTTYFDGRSWRPAPIVEDLSVRTSPLQKPSASSTVPVTTPPPQAESPQPPQPAPVSPVPSIPQPSHEEPRTIQAPLAPAPAFRGPSVPAPLPATPRPPETRREVRSSPLPPAPIVRPKDKPAPTKALPTVTGRYSIQIRAFQEESKARTYMEGLAAQKKERFLQRAVDGSGRVWYRVLLGRFKDRDSAAAFMKNKKILNQFPGSFIQQTDQRD